MSPLYTLQLSTWCPLLLISSHLGHKRGCESVGVGVCVGVRWTWAVLVTLWLHAKCHWLSWPHILFKCSVFLLFLCLCCFTSHSETSSHGQTFVKLAGVSHCVSPPPPPLIYCRMLPLLMWFSFHFLIKHFFWGCSLGAGVFYSQWRDARRPLLTKCPLKCWCKRPCQPFALQIPRHSSQTAFERICCVWNLFAANKHWPR